MQLTEIFIIVVAQSYLIMFVVLIGQPNKLSTETEKKKKRKRKKKSSILRRYDQRFFKLKEVQG